MKKKSKPYMQLDGSIIWKLPSTEYHREDGPAIEWANGTKEWWVNGKLHRANGPAVIFANGCLEWWYENARYRDSSGAPSWGKLLDEMPLSLFLAYVKWMRETSCK